MFFFGFTKPATYHIHYKRKGIAHMRQKQYKVERVYVSVSSIFDVTGYMQPTSITWEDGRTFPIESIRDYHPAESSSFRGDCYTVVIHGQEKHLFFERTDPLFPSRIGRWFVEKISTS